VSKIPVFCHDPVQAGLRALKEGARIFRDIKSGITRTSAGVFALQNELSRAIIVMGNAPSALMTLCELILSGMVMPALVIGTPVGFVNADKSKEQLRAT
jgi:precorrin-8X/cobalt-precorrin-8 methylmutase